MKLELRKNFRIKLFASIFIVLCYIWLLMASITPVKVRAESEAPTDYFVINVYTEQVDLYATTSEWDDVWDYLQSYEINAGVNNFVVYDGCDNNIMHKITTFFVANKTQDTIHFMVYCNDEEVEFTLNYDQTVTREGFLTGEEGELYTIEVIFPLPQPGYIDILPNNKIRRYGYSWASTYAFLTGVFNYYVTAYDIEGEEVVSDFYFLLNCEESANQGIDLTIIENTSDNPPPKYKFNVTSSSNVMTDITPTTTYSKFRVAFSGTTPPPPPLENYPKELVTGWIPNHNDQFKIVVPNLDTMNITEVGGEQRSLALENGYIYQVELITDSPTTAFAKIMNNNTSTELALFNGDSFVVSKPAPEYSVEAFIISGDQDIFFDINEYGRFVFSNCTGIKFYKILVDENSRPFISGEEVFVTNVDDAKPLSYFLNLFTAIDLEDGDVTESITVVLDNYSDNKGVLNTPHKVTIQASDSSNNTTTADFYITVVDVTPPVISGNTNLVQVSYTQTWSVSNFKASLTVQDNYDVLSADDIVIKSNTYQGNETVLGTYTVIFDITDSSGNKGTFLKNVKVIDDILPEFTGPETITSRINTMLTVSYVKAQLTASDEKSGNLTNRITLVEDNYSGNGHKKGTYTVKFSVEDNAGNTAYHTVTIVRVDSIPPKIYVVDGLNIRTSPEIPLTFNQIVDILIATGQQTLNAETQFFLLDEDYFGNEDQIGVYSMTIRSVSTTGVEEEHDVTINVQAEDEEGLTISPAQTIIDWIKNNVVLFVIIVAAVLTVVYLAFKKKR